MDSTPKDVVHTFGSLASSPCLRLKLIFRCMKILFMNGGFRPHFVLGISVMSNCRILTWIGTDLNHSHNLYMQCVMPFLEYDLFCDSRLFHRTSKQADSS